MYSRQILEREFLLLTILWLATMSLPVAGAQSQITFWTTEVEKDRLEIQRDIACTFTRKTGIGVRVIPVQENLLTERVTAAYAARSLPDVLFRIPGQEYRLRDHHLRPERGRPIRADKLPGDHFGDPRRGVALLSLCLHVYCLAFRYLGPETLENYFLRLRFQPKFLSHYDEGTMDSVGSAHRGYREWCSPGNSG